MFFKKLLTHSGHQRDIFWEFYLPVDRLWLPKTIGQVLGCTTVAQVNIPQLCGHEYYPEWRFQKQNFFYLRFKRSIFPFHKGHVHEQGSTKWILIRNSQQVFEFSRLSSLLSRAFSWQDKKMKISGITIGSGALKQYESYCKS